MLGEAVYHQKRTGVFGETVDETEDKDISIPLDIKPIMKKQINFKLYCDMLMEKTDKGRITIDLLQFCKIKFSNHGLPEIIVKLFSFLAQELPEEMAQKKAVQFFGGFQSKKSIGISLVMKLNQNIKE